MLQRLSLVASSLFSCSAVQLYCILFLYIILVLTVDGVEKTLTNSSNKKGAGRIFSNVPAMIFAFLLFRTSAG